MRRRSRSLHDSLDLWWPTVIRYAGLGIVIYETIWDKVDRPSLLVLAAGMMGLKEVVKFAKNGQGGQQ